MLTGQNRLKVNKNMLLKRLLQFKFQIYRQSKRAIKNSSTSKEVSDGIRFLKLRQ